MVVVGTVAVCVLAEYGFARFEFRGKSFMFASTLAILAAPDATILPPLYIVLGRPALGAARPGRSRLHGWRRHGHTNRPRLSLRLGGGPKVWSTARRVPTPAE